MERIKRFNENLNLSNLNSLLQDSFLDESIPVHKKINNTMKYIKYYENFEEPEENLANFRKVLTKEILPENPTNKEEAIEEIDEVKNLSWDVKNPQIKIFLDITTFSDREQTLFGKAIIGWAAMKNWFRGKFRNSSQQINHIGFVFSDGSIFHATTPDGEKNEKHKGILFENGQQQINDPSHYMIYNLPGDEKDVRDLANKLITKIDEYSNKNSSKESEKTGSFYDTPGILRQVFGKWLFPEKEKDLKFYCSELVANFLVRVKAISYEELKSLNESLDEYDEVSPTKLYKLVMKKGDMSKLLVEYKDGNKKVIDPKKYNLD